MALVNSDNRFDWCNNLYYAKTNYNKSECCNIIKNTIKTYKGADEDFVRDICNRTNDKFSVYHLYFPVYLTEYVATFTWVTEKTEDKGSYTVDTTTNHSKRNSFNRSFFKGIYSSLSPDSFVGRNDQRFYILSHVADLDAGIYNDSCVYSKSQMSNLVSSDASGYKPASNAECFINGWSSDVVFVPIAVICYKYGGSEYKSYVNMHNGSTYCHYLISKKTEILATKAKKISLILRIITALSFVASTLLLISNAVNCWDVVWSILGLGLSIAGIIKICTLKHNQQYFNNFYGSNGDVGATAYKQEIIYLVLSIIMFIVSIII